MAHPLCFWRKPFFYAFGNTPPICLTDRLPPEEEARVLLLGCGDPRNILFTLFVERDFGRTGFDFTSCDIEPAVIARNVVLFTLFLENDLEACLPSLWNIFYHLFLDQDSQNLLVRHSRKLLDTSNDIPQWNSGPYGQCIRFCSESTLLQVRALWKRYEATRSMSQVERRRFTTNYKKGISEIRRGVIAMDIGASQRCAGPFAAHLSTEVIYQTLTSFWEKGYIGMVRSATIPNPTFAYTSQGEKFHLHYASNPVLGFHVAKTLAEFIPKSQLHTEGSLAEAVRSQFYSWCKATADLIRQARSKIVIRYFCGDVFRFCRALNSINFPKDAPIGGDYCGPWMTYQLSLSKDYEIIDGVPKAPSMFNVIDTSNLVDHLDLLNVLMAVCPLLDNSPSSVLLTEALHNSEKNELEFLEERLCGNIDLMSLFLNITPKTWYSGLSSRSNVDNMLIRSLGENGVHAGFERIEWRKVFSDTTSSVGGRSIVFDFDQLSKFLFQVYLQMFREENIMLKLQNVNLASFNKFSLLHYCRESFARFLKLVKQVMGAGWDNVVRRLIQLVLGDRTLMMGMNNYQDLITQIHMTGTFRMDDYAQCTMTGVPHITVPDKNMFFRGWRTIPDFVCTIFTVPRSALSPLLGEELGDIGSPVLHMSLESISGNSQSCFSSIHPVFGSLSITGFGEDTVVSIQPQGDDVRVPLQVVFWLPTRILRGGVGADATLALQIHSTPSSTMVFFEKLGPKLELFSAPISDKRHIHFTKIPPNMNYSVPSPEDDSIWRDNRHCLSKNDRNVCKIDFVVALDSTCNKACSITARLTEFGGAHEAELANGAKVEMCTTGFFQAFVKFGSFTRCVEFPLAINPKQLKTRIARKSKYIEIISPIGSFGELSREHHFPPYSLQNSQSFWRIHRVNLDALPLINVAHRKIRSTVEAHISLSYSKSERSQLLDNGLKRTPFNTAELKQTIANIFSKYMDNVQKAPVKRIFGIANCEPGLQTIIFFPSAMRNDLASGTFVLDCCVLFVDAVIDKDAKFISSLIANLGDTLGLKMVDQEELFLWRKLLPFLAERCRTWSHEKMCQYNNRNSSSPDDYMNSPFCSCGKGKPPQLFREVESFKPFIKYVTRCALSPLFPVGFHDEPAIDINFTKGSGALELDVKVAKIKMGCKSCGKSTGLSRCGRCKKVHYCSPDCQKKDWKDHKGICAKA